MPSTTPSTKCRNLGSATTSHAVVWVGIVTILLSSWLLAACSWKPSTAPLALESNWLRSEPCAPPCWEGITPGQSSYQEALAALETLPPVVTTKVVTDMEPGEINGFINWEAAFTQGIQGGIYFEGQAGIVTALRFSQQSLTLQEVVDAFGPPSHILAYSSYSAHRATIGYAYEAVYIPHGFAVSFHGHPGKPAISGEWEDFTLLFFPPTLEGFAHAQNNPSMLQLLAPWQETWDFDTYCRSDAPPSEPEDPDQLCRAVGPPAPSPALQE